MGSLLNRPPTLLRRALLADVLASGAVAILLIAAADPLQELLAIPAPVLRWAGLILVPYVAFVLYVATRDPIPRMNAWVVVEANVLWTIASLLILVTGWISPNVLGTAFVLGQALVVALLGVAQYLGMRQMSQTA